MKKLVLLIAVLSVLLSSCVPALDRDAVVLDVKSISFDKGSSLIFGNKQTIMIMGLPDSTLSIKPIENGFVWSLNKPAYIIINGSNNPNGIIYDSIQSITINGQNVKSEVDNALKQKFDDVNRWYRSDEWHYSMLANLLNNPVLDSLQTLIAYKKGEKKLILLDSNIRVNNFRTFKSTDTIRGNSLKIEFFTTFHSEFLSPNDTENYIHRGDTCFTTSVKSFYTPFGAIEFFTTFHSEFLSPNDKENYIHRGDTCFTTSVKSFYTPFGANEITLTKVENVTKVSFNKIFRALIPKQTIDLVYKHNEGIPISLRQMLYANTYSNEVYATDIANPGYWEFGTIDPSKEYNFEVDKNSCLQNGENKSYLLNSGVFWKGLLPLLIVFVLGLFIIFKFIDYDKVYEGQDNQREGKRWQNYFGVLYSVLFLLSLGRIFVGYNLAFTQPFFSIDFPTAVVISPLILANVLLFWLIYLRNEFGKVVQKKNGFIISGVLFVPLLIIFFVFRNFDIFTYYWDNFNFGKYLSAALSLNKEVLKEFNPYIHTIYLLTILFVVNSIIIIIPKLRKLLGFELLLLGLAFFVLGKNSYSAMLLLVSIGTLWVILSKTNFLRINSDKSWKTLFKNFFSVFLFSIIILLVAGIFFRDYGYFINVWAFLITIVVVISTTYSFYKSEGAGDDSINKKKAKKNTIISLSTGLVMILALLYLGNKYVSNQYDPISSSRFKSRLTTFYKFDQIHESGYRQSEEQSQFFAELTKYAYPSNYNCYEPIHSGISSFIDPVVENDLSAPFALIYQFGKAWWFNVFLLLALWGILSYSVFKMTIAPVPTSNNERRLTKYAVIRLFSLSMLVGSGLWLILSYYGIVPFTGRLIFGLGQDSIAEVFETLFLFVFMGRVGKSKN